MRNSTKTDLPVALTLAGSDSGGGAGIQADLLTFAAHGVFGTTAITALTAQNPDGVSAVNPVPAEFVREQAEQVARYFNIGAAKTGMLAAAEIIHAVADFFEAHREIKIVVDPVMIATSGAKLIDDAAIATLRERLIPLASLVTPNLDEAEVLLGEKFAWRANPKTRSGEISESAEKLAEVLGVPVLLKGGHGNGDEVFDALAFPKAQGGFDSFVKHPRIAETNTHGSGCTLSAAIAANLASGACENLSSAVFRAVDYVSAGISNPLPVAGERFIAHF
ncbi:MAG: bifunctional hydroxymethylpyrimidine kinase/phosphomethylpyrimidine kinase [Opitutales bacterium]|nr:bifunctional hydroxymethylpyrimidine kinase/phosphomethylpyrimidine kinase [Opitutales bacterium]